MFINQLKVSSLEDCLTYYDSDMAVISRRHDNGILVQYLNFFNYVFCLGAINGTALHVSNDFQMAGTGIY